MTWFIWNLVALAMKARFQIRNRYFPGRFAMTGRISMTVLSPGKSTPITHTCVHPERRQEQKQQKRKRW